MKTLLTFLLFICLVFSSKADVSITLTNQTVNGDPVPYEITCGGILSFATTDVYEADLSVISTTDNTVTLNMFTSPYTNYLISTLPLPVSGFKVATTHIIFYSPTIYLGNFRFVANDGIDIAYCDVSVDWPEPVELSSFISIINGRNVELNWTTSTETNNSGFDIERSVSNGAWSKVGNVTGNGTTVSPMNYSFTDRNVASGSYSYRLKQIDFNGNFEYFNLSNEVNVGIPTKFDLSQNYPNPFNPSTSINYEIPFDGKVSLKIFDMAGKEVATLVNEVKTAGYYSYNFNASNLSSGSYFYNISVNNFTSTKKMTLIK